jgi:hypothetical protein
MPLNGSQLSVMGLHTSIRGLPSGSVHTHPRSVHHQEAELVPLDERGLSGHGLWRRAPRARSPVEVAGWDCGHGR